MSKRAHGEGTIYKRKDGRWAAALNDGYTPTGKRRRKTIYGKTQAEVRQKLEKARHAQSQGLAFGDDRKRLSDFLDKWLTETVIQRVRHNTYIKYKSVVDNDIKPGIGQLKLTKMQPQHVQKFINEKRKTHLSTASVRYIHAVLRKALSDAEKWGIVHRNVARLVDPPPMEKKRVQPFNVEETKQFIEALQNDRLKALFLTAIATGMRQGELFGLVWSDVNLDNATVRVEKQLTQIEKKFVRTEPKTQKSHRTITLPDFAVKILKTHKARQREEKLAAGKAWKGSDWDLVFCSTIGTPLNSSNVKRRLHIILDNAGLRRLRFHDLRHTAATLLLVQGVHQRVVMDILGHSQIKLTMDTYSHVIPELQKDAADKMDSLLGSDHTK